jgi:hypothetical protein
MRTGTRRWCIGIRTIPICITGIVTLTPSELTVFPSARRSRRWIMVRLTGSKKIAQPVTAHSEIDEGAVTVSGTYVCVSRPSAPCHACPDCRDKLGHNGEDTIPVTVKTLWLSMAGMSVQPVGGDLLTMTACIGCLADKPAGRVSW